MPDAKLRAKGSRYATSTDDGGQPRPKASEKEKRRDTEPRAPAPDIGSVAASTFDDALRRPAVLQGSLSMREINRQALALAGGGVFGDTGAGARADESFRESSLPPSAPPPPRRDASDAALGRQRVRK